MRHYRVLLPLTVHTEDGSYVQGEEFSKEFSAQDEAENLASGLLELLPLRYRVIGESEVHGTKPGDEFDLALPLGEEELLMQGGHLELVQAEAEKPKRARKARADKD